MTIPDVLVVASTDGLRKVGGMLAAMDASGLVVTTPEFAAVDTAAERMVIDPAAWERRISRTQVALMLLAAAARRRSILSAGALRAAAAGPFEADNLVAIEAGSALAA